VRAAGAVRAEDLHCWLVAINVRCAPVAIRAYVPGTGAPGKQATPQAGHVWPGQRFSMTPPFTAGLCVRRQLPVWFLQFLFNPKTSEPPDTAETRARAR